MGHVISKSIQKLVNSPNLMVIGLNAKAWYTLKIRELSMDWRTPVPPIHTKCTMPLGLNQKLSNLVNLLILDALSDDVPHF